MKLNSLALEGIMPKLRNIIIRPATLNDVGTIHYFIKELALFEREPEAVIANTTDLKRGLFGEDSKIRALLCSLNGIDVGFALYFYNYSTWLGRYGIYLEDLYVSPDHRRQGCGKALLRFIANIAIKEGCGRFEWSVLNWNRSAIEFYENLGAKPQSDWTVYRLTGTPLKSLSDDAN
jgi:GNAT superfamily N-acetyltransferase